MSTAPELRGCIRRDGVIYWASAYGADRGTPGKDKAFPLSIQWLGAVRWQPDEATPHVWATDDSSNSMFASRQYGADLQPDQQTIGNFRRCG